MTQGARYTVTERYLVSQLDRRERCHIRDGYIVRHSGTILVDNYSMAEVLRETETWSYYKGYGNL